MASITPAQYRDCSADEHGRDESLAFMMASERTTYACNDYLGVYEPKLDTSDDESDDSNTSGGSSSRSHGISPPHSRRGRRSRGRRPSPASTHSIRMDPRPGAVTPVDRTRIVDWCYAVVDRCRFDRESVAVAMNLVDRFLSRALTCPEAAARKERRLRDRGQYQLLAVAALYASIKVHERCVVSSHDFSVCSRGTYAREEIEAVELELLTGLGWRICPPTPLQVAYRVLDLVESRVSISRDTMDFVRDEVAFQCECAVRGYSLSLRRASAVAAAAIANAVDMVDDEDERAKLMPGVSSAFREYPFDSVREISEARRELRGLVGGNEEAPHVQGMRDSWQEQHVEITEQHEHRDGIAEPHEEYQDTFRWEDLNASLQASARDVASLGIEETRRMIEEVEGILRSHREKRVVSSEEEDDDDESCVTC